MDSPDNTQSTPIIPAGTNTQGGLAYNPLVAAQMATGTHLNGYTGQGTSVPVSPLIQQNAPVAQNAPEGITFAELASKKGFATPDDMAKAYSNLESHNKKVEMTAADIIKSVYEANPTAAPVAPVPSVMSDVAMAQPTSDAQAIQIVQSIVKDQVKPLQEQLALQNLFLKNPDAKDFAEGIAKAVKENPGIPWEAAYKLAKYDALETTAREAGRAEAEQTQQLKQSVLAGSPTPTAGRGGVDIRGIIKDKSVPFSEVDKVVREFLRTNQPQ